jgi:hypothetical protein
MQRFPQHPVIKHPQTMFSVHEGVLHPCKKGKIRVLYILSFPFLGSFTKLQKATVSFDMSLHLSSRPHETTMIPPNGFLCNLIFEYFL